MRNYKSYTDEEISFMVVSRTLKKTWETISEEMKQKFGHARTPNNLSTKYNKIIGIYNQLLSFDKELSYNTIIYGTLYNKIGVNYFSCENIFYFKGDYIGDNIFIDKMKIIQDIFDNYINQKIYTNNFLYIGIPYFTDNNKEIYKNIPFMHYEVSHITFINLNEIENLGIILNNKDIQITCLRSNSFKLKAA